VIARKMHDERRKVAAAIEDVRDRESHDSAFKQHWDFIQVVADELLKRTCLNDTDVEALRPKPPPPG
jgi:hypothetical protein